MKPRDALEQRTAPEFTGEAESTVLGLCWGYNLGLALSASKG